MYGTTAKASCLLFCLWFVYVLYVLFVFVARLPEGLF